jgi:nucleotide-binding universal stress UspA family protein
MKILLPIDGSKFSDAAVQTLLARPQPADADVRLLFVVERPTLLAAREMSGYDSALDQAWEAERRKAREIVESAAERLRSKGLKASGTVVDGDPKSKILEAAGDWPADLIVLGSHGRKGLQHFLMGSVSEAVARHATCSVEIVRISRDR